MFLLVLKSVFVVLNVMVFIILQNHRCFIYFLYSIISLISFCSVSYLSKKNNLLCVCTITLYLQKTQKV